MYRSLADIASGHVRQSGTAANRSDPQREPVVFHDWRSRYARPSWHHSHFDLEEQLHEGPCSSVHRVRDHLTGDQLCLKVYNKAKLSEVQLQQVVREAEIHSRLSHPYILHFLAAWEDNTHFFLLLEFAPSGDLYKSLQTHGGKLSELAVVGFVLQPLLSALCYIHGMGIIHRDLKPENIMFTKQSGRACLRLADFGLAINAFVDSPTARTGTLDYMAPEVLRSPKLKAPEKGPAFANYNDKADVWSLGVLLYELFVGAPPFEEEDCESTVNAILTANPEMPDWISSDAKSFLSSCLEKNPQLRPTVLELRKHPWLQARTTASERYTPGHIQGLWQSGASERSSAHERDQFQSVDFRADFPKSPSVLGRGNNGAVTPPNDLSQYSSISCLVGASSVLGTQPGGENVRGKGNAFKQDFDSARGLGGIQPGMGSPRRDGAGETAGRSQLSLPADSYMRLADMVQQR